MNTLPATGKPALEIDLQSFTEFALSIQDNYRYHIKAWAIFAADYADSGTGILEVIRDYFKNLNRSDLAASTIRCRRQAIKDRVRRAIAVPSFTDSERAIIEDALQRIDREPGLKCPTPKAPGPLKTLSPDEYRLLLEKARSERQRRFIEFLSVTGCRVSEMTGTKLSNCKQESTYVAITVQGKGTRAAAYKERTVYISRGLFERIRETFSGSVFLFETGNGKRYSRSYVSNQLGKLTLSALGRRLSAHKFRHSAITRLIGEKKPMDAVSRYVGHSSIQVTMRYAHNRLTPEDVLGFAV